jgi:hypothetical protein
MLHNEPSKQKGLFSIAGTCTVLPHSCVEEWPYDVMVAGFERQSDIAEGLINPATFE